MTHSLRAPYSVLFIAAAVGIMCVAASVWISVQQPWLGVNLKSLNSNSGALVTSINRNSPAALILSPGDNILSLQATSGKSIRIQNNDLVEDPDIFPTFAGYNIFLSRQGRMAGILREPIVKLLLEDGREVRVQPAPGRPVSSLPPQFWMLNIIGIIVLMIGAGVFAVRPKDIAPRLFFGSGAGFLITTTSIAVIVSRELALDPSLIHAVRTLYHTGNGIYTTLGIGLLYFYPSRLSTLPVTRFLALMVTFFMLNEQFQWTDLPGHSVFIQPTIYLAIGLTIGVLQWRRSLKQPVDRAALKWFLLGYLGFVGFAWFIYFALGVIYGHAVVPISAGLGSVMLMYISLAMGVLKYRLFDIDRWWINIWMWFFAGVFILALDAFLSLTIISNSSTSLVISLVLTGWLYFPVRQWLWGRLYGSSPKNLEVALPVIIAAILEREKDGTAAWEDVLRKVFRPLSLEETPENIREGRLEKYGEIMVIPALKGTGSIVLKMADHGNRLFSPSDLRLAKEIFEIARQAEDSIAAYNRGAGEERERIMRDLHDDIGGRLLSLVHLAKSRRQMNLTRETLKALRDITYSINPDTIVSVEEAMAKWRYELRERCEGAGVLFHWSPGSCEDTRPLTPRQLTNISRVLSEAASNAFTHAHSSNFWVQWEFQDGHITGIVKNDGKVPGKDGLVFGKGIKNMERRISDLDGSFGYESNQNDGIFEVRFSLPLRSKSTGA